MRLIYFFVFPVPFFLSILLFAQETAIPPADQQARQIPDWMANGIIYQINPRAFTEEGTLSAATRRLPELARLGVTIVYLCPVFVADDDPRQEFWSQRQKKSGMNNPKNPYRMKDYFHVDPEYGTDADLKSFIDEVHRCKMRILLDLVYLHCGPSAIPITEHPDFAKRDESGNIVNAAWSFPGLDFENPELCQYLWRNMEYWVTEFDVDGYRTDVSDGIPLSFWEEGRRRLEKIRPDIGILAEGMRTSDQLYAFDVNYGFGFYNVFKLVMDGKKPVSQLVESIVNIRAKYPRGARFIRYIDNHDISNDDYEKRRETVWGFDGVNAALLVCWTLDGIPFLYCGQEVADKARHSIFGKMPVDWANGQTEEGRERFAFCQKINELRKTHSPLTAGTLDFIPNNADDKVISFERKNDEEKLLVVVNLRNEPLQVELETSLSVTETILLRGRLSENGGKITLVFPVYGYFVGKTD